MKTSSQIYMDYRNVRKKAERLDELAREMRSTVKEELETYRQNKNYWKGESGDELRKKLKKLEDNVNKRAKDLESTANGLREAADRQYHLEMALIAMFSK